jgi:L-threonine-O-3-phosphate decarboxylase
MSSCEISPRLETGTLPPSVHGGLDQGELARLGLRADDVLDFSVNRNPFGPPSRVRKVWQGLHLERYPDRECLALRPALAKRHGCAPEQVWVGNGTSELIWLLALAYLQPGDPLLVVSPTFGEYTVAGKLMGAQVEVFAARQGDGFRLDVDALAARLDEARPRLTFLCNPNNPTGVYLGQVAVEALLAANPRGLLILDEVYVPFVAEAWDSSSLLETGRLVVLRSLTKDYALAGLRLGYLLAAAEIVEAVRRVQPPWSVNTVAQAAALAALQEKAYLQHTLAQTAVAKAELTRELTALGLHVWPSATHFFLVEVGDAAATRRGLLERGILVRDCTSFGLPAFVRVATRRPEENRRLVAAWRELLGT